MRNEKSKILLAGCILWLGSCGTLSAVQLIADRHLQTGLSLKNRDTAIKVPEGILQCTDVFGPPLWSLAQWDSHSDIYGTVPAIFDSGSFAWEDQNKTLIMGPEDTTNSDLILGVDSVSEYGGVYRDGSVKDWPHLLVSQVISAPGGTFGSSAPWISELSEVDFNLDVRLTRAENIYTNGYNPSTHRAQFNCYFTIQNLNTALPDHGNYLWFGLKIYDDYVSLPGLFILQDKGTGKLIYNIGIAPFCTHGLVEGQWENISGDILPYIKAALNAAWAQGYLTNSTNYADYKIGSMNMGWEVSGLSRVAMQIRDFGVEAYGPNFAKPYEFNTDGYSEGWNFLNMTNAASGGVTNGTWILTVPGDDPQMLGPAMRLNTSLYKQVLIRMENDGNPMAGGTAQLYWKRSGDSGFSGTQSVSIAVINDGGWRKYTFDMSSDPGWNGEIVQLRLDPVMYGDGHNIGVDYIRPVTVSNSFAKTPALTLISNIRPLSMFWKSRPHEIYTVQTSTDLVNGVWANAPDFTDQLPSDLIMFYSLSPTNLIPRGYLRLQSSPGP